MKLIRCNRFVAVGLALLLLGGCSAPTDIPASSSSEVSFSASSGVSSGALSSLQRDADGVLVIPPEMFNRENATAFPTIAGHPDLFAVEDLSKLSDDPLPYLLSDEHLPTTDFDAIGEADTSYLLRCAITYAYLAQTTVPAPYRPEGVALEDYRTILEQVKGEGKQIDRLLSRAEIDVAAKTLFGDAFTWPSDPADVVDPEDPREWAIAYHPDADCFSLSMDQGGLLFEYPVVIKAEYTDETYTSVRLIASPLPQVLIGDGVRGYMLDYRGQMIYYSDRYADIFKAALLEVGECYELVFEQADSDFRYCLSSLRLLSDLEQRALWT